MKRTRDLEAPLYGREGQFGFGHEPAQIGGHLVYGSDKWPAPGGEIGHEDPGSRPPDDGSAAAQAPLLPRRPTSPNVC